jgi:hypothetical protein
MVKLFIKRIYMICALGASLQISSLMHASETTALQKVGTWIDKNAPTAQCELIGTLGRGLAVLPEDQKRIVYKKCGWHFLGVTKDGKPRHPHAFDAVNPTNHEPLIARGTFLRSAKTWDEWSDVILEKYKEE